MRRKHNKVHQGARVLKRVGVPTLVHAANSQSPGHGAALHATSRSSCEEHLPPAEASASTARVCFWTPPPHCLEHEPRSFHAPSTQSVGHACVLHATVLERRGQLPPARADLSTRRRMSCTPVPQGTLGEGCACAASGITEKRRDNVARVSGKRHFCGKQAQKTRWLLSQLYPADREETHS